MLVWNGEALSEENTNACVLGGMLYKNESMYLVLCINKPFFIATYLSLFNSLDIN